MQLIPNSPVSAGTTHCQKVQPPSTSQLGPSHEIVPVPVLGLRHLSADSVGRRLCPAPGLFRAEKARAYNLEQITVSASTKQSSGSGTGRCHVPPASNSDIGRRGQNTKNTSVKGKWLSARAWNAVGLADAHLGNRKAPDIFCCPRRKCQPATGRPACPASDSPLAHLAAFEILRMLPKLSAGHASHPDHQARTTKNWTAYKLGKHLLSAHSHSLENPAWNESH